MKSREERREESRKYHGDVAYDVWRSGKNADRVDYDRVSDSYYQGISSEDAARSEIRIQNRAIEAKRQREQQEEYPEDNMEEE